MKAKKMKKKEIWKLLVHRGATQGFKSVVYNVASYHSQSTQIILLQTDKECAYLQLQGSQ